MVAIGPRFYGPSEVTEKKPDSKHDLTRLYRAGPGLRPVVGQVFSEKKPVGLLKPEIFSPFFIIFQKKLGHTG
jgi:hypothetical protein